MVATLPFTRDFVLLWHGQLVSQLGNQAFLIASTMLLLESTGSASLVAATMMAGTLPLVIVGPVGGAVADRHSRRSILILTDLLRAVSMAALAWLLVRRPDFTPVHIGVIVAVATLNGVMSALFAPAFQAFVPELVPRDRLGAANAVNQVSAQASTLTGQAIGGILYVAWGPAALLLVDAASFAYAAGATSLVAPDRRRPTGRTAFRNDIREYFADSRDGLAYVWRHHGMAAVLAVFAGVNCLFMPVFVLLPFYVRDVLGAGPAWYGFLLSGGGAGAVTGSLTAGLLVRETRGHASLVGVCLGGIAAGVLLLAATELRWVALAALAGIAALSSVINVTVTTRFQTAAPAEVRGRVMALVIAISTAAVPIGMMIGGVLGDLGRGSLPAVFGVTGTALAGLALVSWASRAFGRFFGTPSVQSG